MYCQNPFISVSHRTEVGVNIEHRFYFKQIVQVTILYVDLYSIMHS